MLPPLPWKLNYFLNSGYSYIKDFVFLNLACWGRGSIWPLPLRALLERSPKVPIECKSTIFRIQTVWTLVREDHIWRSDTFDHQNYLGFMIFYGFRRWKFQTSKNGPQNLVCNRPCPCRFERPSTRYNVVSTSSGGRLQHYGLRGSIVGFLDFWTQRTRKGTEGTVWIFLEDLRKTYQIIVSQMRLNCIPRSL